MPHLRSVCPRRGFYPLPIRRAALLTCLTLTLALAAPAAHAEVQPRIIGGSTTTIGQYPWQAAVVFDPAKVPGNPFQRQFCGGSLVTPYIVLTAGHCVHQTDPDNNSDLDADDVDVILGQTTLSTAPPSSELNVQGVAKQSNYDDSYGPGQGVPSNDVAYLVLQTPYNGATPIDIAGPSEGALWAPSSLEQVSGWGATAESGPGSGGSDILRHATVPIVTDMTCGTDYGSFFNISTMVCAGYPAGGIDTCYGDSGGPMQAPIGGGAYRLVGITSWGSGCAQPNAPGVYTRVADATLRSAVASKVFSLETQFGLPHKNIIGAADTDPPETAIDSGPSGPTNVSTPTFGFSSDETYSTFECRFDSNPFAACSGPGATHTPAVGLTDGAHTFEVRAIDTSDNTDPTPASQGFTVDTQAPSDPTVSSTSHTVSVPSSDPTVDVTFSGAADSLSGVDGFSYQWSTSASTLPDTVKDAEETATGTTSPSFVADGSYYFHLRTRDNAGNWTSTVHLGPFVIDTDPPETSIDSGPPGPTNDSTPTFGFSSDETDSTFECRLDSDAFAACSGPGATHTPAALTDGAHTFEVRATDVAGNTDPAPASQGFTVDTELPTDPTVSSTSHTVSVASDDPTVDLTFSGATDSLSGVDGFSYQWSTSPSTLPDTTKEAEETATGTTSPSLADGSWYFHLRTRDNAGNWTSTVHLGPFVIETGNVDNDPPETSIDSGPSGPTNDPTPTFVFSSDEPDSTFECRFSGSFDPCSGPGATHTPATPLADGVYTFEVRATDLSNNTDDTPATHGFTVDTEAPSDPTVSSSSHTVGVTSNDPTVDVTFSGATDSLSGVDGFSYVWNNSPSTVPDTTKDAEETATGTTSPELADGSHYFHLRTRDNAGNWTSTVHLGPFVIDADPPETSIDSGPSGPTNDSTPTFTFSSDEAGSTFECRFAGSFDPCSGPGDTHTPAAPLVDGVYTFEVRATDLSNNTDLTPATQGFTVDTQAPSDPTVSSSSHTVGVASSDPTVDLSLSGATDALSGVDGFSYVWDTSPSTLPDTTKDAEETATGTTSPALADGSHYFHLRTRDNAGNWTSTVHLGPFVIDTSPPGPPPPGGTPDGTPPVGSVSAKLKRSGSVKVVLGCDEDCAATAGGMLIAGGRSFKLAQVKADVGASGSVTLKLAAKGRAARRAVHDLLASGAAGKAKLKVLLSDRTGNSITEKIAAKLRR